MNVISIIDINFFKSISLEAGKIAKDFQNSKLKINRKNDSSIVTEADISVQNYIVENISKKYPDFQFIYEENFNTSEKLVLDDEKIYVIIDPIDGTAMYSMFLPFWCVSIGIFKGGTPLYGFIYSPGIEMLFYNDNENSYINDNKINILKNPKIDSETNIFHASEIQNYYKIDFPGKLRNLGSTALHAALTIDNHRNRVLAFIGKSFIWDWAGAIPIILKAGGSIKYIDESNLNIQRIIDNEYALPEFLIAYNSDEFEPVKDIFIKQDI